MTEREQLQGKSPHPKYIAIRFLDEEALLQPQVQELLNDLASRKPFEHEEVGEDTLILPYRLCKPFRSALKREHIKHSLVPVTPISELSPERQARLRGLLGGK